MVPLCIAPLKIAPKDNYGQIDDIVRMGSVFARAAITYNSTGEKAATVRSHLRRKLSGTKYRISKLAEKCGALAGVSQLRIVEAVKYLQEFPGGAVLKGNFTR